MVSDHKNALNSVPALLSSVPTCVNQPAQCSPEMQASLRKGWEEDLASKMGSHLYQTLSVNSSL